MKSALSALADWPRLSMVPRRQWLEARSNSMVVYFYLAARFCELVADSLPRMQYRFVLATVKVPLIFIIQKKQVILLNGLPSVDSTNMTVC
jgi:hypothetical protein